MASSTTLSPLTQRYLYIHYSRLAHRMFSHMFSDAVRSLMCILHHIPVSAGSILFYDHCTYPIQKIHLTCIANIYTLHRLSSSNSHILW